MSTEELVRSIVAETGAIAPGGLDDAKARNEWPYPVPGNPGNPGDGQAQGPETPPADSLPAMAVANANEEERQRRIAELAYRISEENGFPQGMELEHWLEAERRLSES